LVGYSGGTDTAPVCTRSAAFTRLTISTRRPLDRTVVFPNVIHAIVDVDIIWGFQANSICIPRFGISDDRLQVS
jgi:hypothetical protein